MGRVLVVGGLLLLCACGVVQTAFYPPGDPDITPRRVVVPSDARIVELARQDRSRAPIAEAPMAVTFYPPIILAGSSTWLRCFVPRSVPAGRLELTVGGLFRLNHPLDLPETKRLLERVPCGRHVAVCRVTTYGGRVYEREATLEAKGDCNEDRGGA